MKIVADTSTIIAVIVGESEKAKLIQRTKGASIIVPASVNWEIGNAFSAMLKRSRITLEQAIQAIEIYQQIALQIVEIDIKTSLRLANKHNIYAYDAYILQCAIQYHAPLISLDQTMIQIAKQENIPILEV